MGGFQTGHCNIEKSALYFIWKRGISTLLECRKNNKRVVLKVLMPHLETCGLQTGQQLPPSIVSSAELTLKGSGGGTIMPPPLSKSNALDLWLGPHLQNICDYSN